MGAQPQEHLPGRNWEILRKSVGKGLGENEGLGWRWAGEGEEQPRVKEGGRDPARVSPVLLRSKELIPTFCCC